MKQDLVTQEYEFCLQKGNEYEVDTYLEYNLHAIRLWWSVTKKNLTNFPCRHLKKIRIKAKDIRETWSCHNTESMKNKLILGQVHPAKSHWCYRDGMSLTHLLHKEAHFIYTKEASGIGRAMSEFSNCLRNKSPAFKIIFKENCILPKFHYVG